MKQLELEFPAQNPIDNYRSETIDKGQNDKIKWDDTISDDGKEITYHEYIYDTPDYMEL